MRLGPITTWLGKDHVLAYLQIFSHCPNFSLKISSFVATNTAGRNICFVAALVSNSGLSLCGQWLSPPLLTPPDDKLGSRMKRTNLTNQMFAKTYNSNFSFCRMGCASYNNLSGHRFSLTLRLLNKWRTIIEVSTRERLTSRQEI